jgi:catechol 1,2-dioxygenase
MQKAYIKQLAARISGTQSKPANERVKAIVDRLLLDLFNVIDDFDVRPEEFWSALSYLTELGKSNEAALLAAGLGIEHYFDVRLDEKEREGGIDPGSTPRTIEGPLYVVGAPVSHGEARIDDDTDKGEILFMDGQVTDTSGKPIPGAKVEVWHANTLGNYSFFDKTQRDFNLRHTIIADAEGRYRFRSIMPSGYACPPDGPTQQLLDLLGRHGRRPAHIHFMVSAPGYRQLTTQINIKGDPYLHDDFAFATRDELIPEVTHHTDAAEQRDRSVNRPFATVTFDFALPKAVKGVPATLVDRPRATVA